MNRSADPRTDHALGGLALLAIVAAAGVLRLVPDARTQAQANDVLAEITALHTSIDAANAHLRAQAEATRAIEQRLGASDDLDDTARAGLNARLAELNAAAQALGLSVESLRTGDATTTGPITRRAIDAAYLATPAQMLELLATLRDRFPDIAVEGLSARRAGARVRIDLRLVWISSSAT